MKSQSLLPSLTIRTRDRESSEGRTLIVCHSDLEWTNDGMIKNILKMLGGWFRSKQAQSLQPSSPLPSPWGPFALLKLPRLWLLWPELRVDWRWLKQFSCRCWSTKCFKALWSIERTSSNFGSKVWLPPVYHKRFAHSSGPMSAYPCLKDKRDSKVEPMDWSACRASATNIEMMTKPHRSCNTGMLLWLFRNFSYDTHLLPTALTKGPMRFRVQASPLDSLFQGWLGGWLRVYFRSGVDFRFGPV